MGKSVNSLSKRERNRERWWDLIVAWKHSGESQSAYCKANGLDISQFAYYRRVLGASRRAQGRLLPVSVSNQSNQLDSPQDPLLVCFPGGAKMVVPCSCDDSLLRRLICALRGE